MVKDIKAIDVLKDYWKTFDPLKNVPIPVGDIAQKLGIYVWVQSFEKNYNRDKSGYLEIAGDVSVIYINEKDHPYRQRFTIAHELAHFLTYPEVMEHAVYRDDRFAHYPEERQANNFASEFLMPGDLIRREYRELVFPTVSDLAKKFQVSNRAMESRLKRLKLRLNK